MVKLCYTSKQAYVKGMVNGTEVLIQDTPEQISAFIMKHRFQDVMITDDTGFCFITTIGEFVDRCVDTYYLQKYLLPVLVPMQTGEKELIEFVPYSVS